MAPCIRRLSSLMSCVAVAMANPSVAPCPRVYARGCRRTRAANVGLPGPREGSRTDECRAPFSSQSSQDRTLLPDREHNDRHTVFPGKRECCGVHDLEVLLERLVVGQPLIMLGPGVPLGVSAIDAVDVGGFEHGAGP